MSLINSDVIPASATGGYTIDQSLKIDNSPYDSGTNNGDEKKLTWSLGSDGNRKTWTVSFWFKGISDDNACKIFQCYDTTLRIGANGILYFISEEAGGNTLLYSSASFRDFSAWYHFVVSVDTTQSTASDRVKIYVNGERITDWSTEQYQAQDTNTFWNHHDSSFPMYWGVDKDGYSQELQAYLSEIHSIDGQQLDPTYFGETGTYGDWKPIAYTGSYGTKGYYLNFSNASSLGADSSGNGNNFTVSNLSANDQVLDSPTNNFATFNRLYLPSSSYNGSLVYSEGNLKLYHSGSTDDIWRGTLAVTSGKYYYEFCVTNNSAYGHWIGVGDTTAHSNPNYDTVIWQLGTHSTDGGQIRKVINGSDTQLLAGNSSNDANVGDICAIAFDVDAGTVKFYKNNSLIYTATSISLDDWGVFGKAQGGSGRTFGLVLNAGQDSSFAGNKTAQGNTDGNNIGDFYYTPPSGYLALCTANLPDPAVIPSEHFNTVLYTGTATSNSITGIGFQPDFVWLKNRQSGTAWHNLHDAVRGNNKFVFSNATNAENDDGSYLTSFDSDGFTVATADTWWNANGHSYVSWNWKANGSGVSNTNGSITSTVSANQDAGFSIVTYTGNGSGGATVGHGLTQAPEMIIGKSRDSALNWAVYHSTTDATDVLTLNTTSATVSNNTAWNNTEPTSSVFSLGTGTRMNTSGDLNIAYCFHSVDGFSKVGSYTGNGSTDGTFVYTGFRPAFVIQKRTDSTSNWVILDNKREGYNPDQDGLDANSSGTEGTAEQSDFLSNGFKLRNSSNGSNGSGGSFIYIAFAENPFKYTNAR